MRRLALTLPPVNDRSPLLVALAWTSFAALFVALLIAASEYRSLERRLAELGAQERQLAVRPSERPAEVEVAKAEYLSWHAAVRFADWNETFASLSKALPPGMSVERLSLNARTGKGEAFVRMSRVADATRVTERLSAGDSSSSAALRRCDQAGARADAPIRCEIELAWKRGRP